MWIHERGTVVDNNIQHIKYMHKTRQFSEFENKDKSSIHTKMEEEKNQFAHHNLL